MTEIYTDGKHHLIQTPKENLADMLFGEFFTQGLSNEEILNICDDCLVEADFGYSYMCIAEYYALLCEFSKA